MRNFNNIYEKFLKESNAELEKLRNKYFVMSCIYTIIYIGVSGVFFWKFVSSLVETSGSNNYIEYGLMCLILFVPGLVILHKAFKLWSINDYNKLYKFKVVKKFIECYDSNCKCYCKNNCINSFGEVDGYQIDINESEYSLNKFCVCIGVKLNNYFDNPVNIKTDFNDEISGVIENQKKIEMDSQEFENFFNVYADDKIQAMQILTSDVMSKLIDFVCKTQIKFKIMIDGHLLRIFFDTDNIFQADLYKSSVDFDTLKRWFDIFEFGIEFAKIIDEIQE